MNENQLQEMREFAIKQYSITEENEPSPEALKKTKKEVGAMKPGGEVKMPKAKTDPSRNYAQEAMKTAKGNAAERIAASHAKPDRTSKPTKPPGMSNDERKAETKKITAARVGAGGSSKPVTDAEIIASNQRKRPIATAKKTTPQKAIDAHTQYKRIGIALAESMGLRVDEVAGAVVKLVAPMVIDKVADKLKKKKKDKPVEEGTAMSSYLRKLMEQAGLNTSPVSRGPNDRYANMKASDVKKATNVDSKVQSDVAKENKTVSRRVGANTDVNASQLIQQRRNRASAEKEAARKKTLKTGKQQDTKPSIIPQETEKDRRAGGEADRKKVSDAGEQ